MVPPDWRPTTSDLDVFLVVVDDSLEQKNTEKYFADHHRYREPAGEYREVISCSRQILGVTEDLQLLRSGEAGEHWDCVEEGCEEKEDQ